MRAEPIDDVKKLPGRSVSDQEFREIGEVKEVYGPDPEQAPMWVSVEASFGMEKRIVFVPISRLKEEDGELRVPYSKSHIEDSPEIEAGGELSEEDERHLRDHYGIDRGDQEIRSDNEDSYVTRVPEADGPAKAIEIGDRQPERESPAQ
ncbi:MAG: hypothetical protein ACYC91_04075 [Solirubrobacteraceae bacterium]